VTTFTASDRRFLKSVGISSQPTCDESSTTQNPTLDFLQANGVPLTRENYLAVAYLGNPPNDAEPDAELPDSDSEDCE
jgi:hypothetical protein